MGRKAKARARAKEARAARAAEARDVGTAGTEDTIEPLILAERLAGLSTLLLRRLDRSGSDAGLTEARRSALALLALGGPRTLGSLAAAEGVRPPTMTRMVSAMEADGLVERAPSPRDGRLVILRATPAGEALLARSRSARLGSIAASLGGLDGPERSAIGKTLATLERALRDG